MHCPELPPRTGNAGVSHRVGGCAAHAFNIRNGHTRACIHRLVRTCLCAAVAFGAGIASASVASAGEPADWRPVETAVLDSTRGGFTLGSGLVVSFGIERLVSINGNVVARTNVELADLGRLGSGPARQADAALSSVKLIQNGHDNIYADATAAASLGGLVIQNSLNEQAIRSQTVISASVNSMSLLKTLNFQNSVGEALARSANPY
jgi:hypothetical protein